MYGYFSYSKNNNFNILNILMKKENKIIKTYTSFSAIEKEFNFRRYSVSSIFRKQMKIKNNINWQNYEWEIIEKIIKTSQTKQNNIHII